MKLTITTTTVAAAVALAFGTSAIAQQQQGHQQQQQQQQAQGESQKKGIVSVTGKVMGNLDLKTTKGDVHQLLKLQRQDGGNVIVDLGMGGPSLEKGDRVFVTGHSARINEKPVIFARYAGKLEQVGQSGATADGGAGTMELWNDNDWVNDPFGYYDQDFNWTADNSGFTSFYGDSDRSWGLFYDDVGDEGLFDV